MQNVRFRLTKKKQKKSSQTKLMFSISNVLKKIRLLSRVNGSKEGGGDPGRIKRSWRECNQMGSA